MELITLDNGLRIALELKNDVHSAAINISVAAGNRFETPENAGVSHFIEHMVFKGTSSRSCEDIARESDIMGGQLNAFTSKEYTCFYSRCLYEHVGRTLSLLCDMVCNSLLDPRDIETEKGVVLEEIGMYEDSPEDCCSDKLTALSFKGHPMGFNILGTRDTVSSFSTDTLRQYMAKNYVPERIVISICGRSEKSEVLEIITSCFGGLKNTNNPLKYGNLVINGGITLCPRDSEQTQLSFCFNGLSNEHPLRYAAAFYSSVTGGASSSKINRRIREELGLAYSAYTFTAHYLGGGVFGVSAGLAFKNQERFFSEVAKILKATKEDIAEEEIELTREQFKAGTVLSNESMSAIASSAGRQLLLSGEYCDLGGVLGNINRVTKSDVLEAARLIANPETIALSAVGETENEAFYREMLEKFK